MFHIELVSYSRYAQAEGPDIVIDILLAEVPERYKTKAYILSLALYLCQLSKKSRTVFSCGHKVLILDSEEAGHVKEFLNQRLRQGLKVIPVFFRGMMLQSNTATDGECAQSYFSFSSTNTLNRSVLRSAHSAAWETACCLPTICCKSVIASGPISRRTSPITCPIAVPLFVAEIFI